ncbi:hypothetical protein BV20DRAFT_965558 [Pilatotrama ljubarskyi]|nr:hypothetical protein BV20DRAFT_965558 [Pilatotrama ljubarskyi]
MVQANIRQTPQPTSSLAYADDWLARDHDIETPVYLVIEIPPASTGVQATRWSIGWRVGGLTEGDMKAWRQLAIEASAHLVDMDEPSQYAYRGPLTKTLCPAAVAAKWCMVTNTTLAVRKRIEELAKTTDIATSGEAETLEQASQKWTQRLLEEMAAFNLIAAERREQVVAQAHDS